MSVLRALVPFLLAAGGAAFAENASAGRLYAGLETGRHPVGFRMVLAWDQTRTFPIGGRMRARPVAISVWYPAAGRTGKTLRLRDYLAAEHEAIRQAGIEETPADPVEGFLAEPLGRGADRPALEKLLSLPVIARRDAAPAAGALPVVLYAHTPTISKALIGEYLASHGFVMVSAAVVGTFERDLDVGLSGAETQARDLEFARLRNPVLSGNSPAPTAVAGMSFGGLSAVCYALRHPEVRAIVSLDGGIGSTSGAATVQQSPYFETARLAAPLLHLYQPEGADLAWLESLRYQRRVFARFDDLRHADFSGSGLFEGVVPAFFGPPSADRSAPRARVWAMVLEFLEESLRGNHRGAGRQEAPTSGIVEIRTIEALPAPPRLEDLRSLYRSSGFAAIDEAYRRLSAHDPRPFSEETCRRLGGWLLDTGQARDARNLFALQVEMYPGSARAHYFLANAERRLGEADSARAHFARALELLPGDAGLDPPTRARIETAARQALESK